MASALCKVAGRDVPIYPGEASPIGIGQAQKTAPQALALDRWEHEVDFPAGEAVGFLAETIRRSPGEVVLLTIGPLTNIGMLFRDFPDVPALLKGIVMMCGSYVEGIPQKEWNAGGDPDATKIVFSSGPASLMAIGLNVTTRVKMASAEAKARFRAPLLRPVLDFAEIWFRDNDQITFHDPLAAATIFDPEICGFERGTVKIDVSLGTTCWHPGDGGSPHSVATNVDGDRFLEHYFRVLGRST